MRSHSIVFYQLLVFYALGVLATVVVPLAFEPDETHFAASSDHATSPAAGILVPVDGTDSDMKRSVQPVDRQDLSEQVEKDV